MCRRKNWISHILRAESLSKGGDSVLDDRKKTKGRKQLGMLNEFLKESSNAELKRKQERMENIKAKNLLKCMNTNNNDYKCFPSSD